uniref:Adenine phosphoribosyltransferase n=2 Tax=Schistocephalus solidus TaxID=70667 RepID=A0A0V0J991_SCHSO
MDARIQRIKDAIGNYPDFPKKGVQFKDLFGIFKDPKLIQESIDFLADIVAEHYTKNKPLDAIVGLDARGFLLGPMLAVKLNCAFVPIRKANKLPGECFSENYELEYGTATLELSKSALSPGARVLVLDDLIAIGGTLAAACRLVRKASADLIGCVVLVELTYLNGREKLEELGVSVQSLITF